MKMDVRQRFLIDVTRGREEPSPEIGLALPAKFQRPAESGRKDRKLLRRQLNASLRKGLSRVPSPSRDRRLPSSHPALSTDSSY